MVCNAEQVVVSHGELCWASGCESWCVMLRQWLWIMVCYAEPVGVKHGVILSQWLLIMDCYTVAKVVNNGVLYWASGCKLWCVILSKWMWIMVSFTVPVVVNNDLSCWVSDCEICCTILVNHGALCWAIGCESWFVMLCQWLWVMVSYVVPGVWIMGC
jgi:hypothetical protein